MMGFVLLVLGEMLAQVKEVEQEKKNVIPLLILPLEEEN